MPTYEYQCAGCGPFEVEDRITAPPRDECPHCCSRQVTRLISQTAPPQFVRGPSGGWSGDGYSKKPHERQNEAILGRPLRPALK